MKLIASAILSICVSIALTLSGIAQQKTQATRKMPASQTKSGDRMVEYLNRSSASTRPFSEAVRVGDLLILSGKLGTDSTGKLVSGGIKPETKQTMDNIRGALEAYGSSLNQVVKCTVMLADMKEWADMNEVYRTFFKPERLPARSALGVNGLALGARVEIECWAAVNKSK
jgi:2-iminobutanoate/2-iminopropanoate deaminase